MTRRYIFLAVLLGMVAVGCGSSRSRTLSIARDVGIPKLRADLRTLIASPAAKQHEIPQTAWPASVQRFRPMAVQQHMGGVLIVVSLSGREQEGLLVMLDPSDDPGGGGSGVSYGSLGDGLFWCWEKIR